MTVQSPPTGTYWMDPQRSSITFTTRHLFGLGKVTGAFDLNTASITVAAPATDSSVHAAIDAATFRTDTPRRDDHVRSPAFLDTNTHPHITFESTGVIQGETGWHVDGQLTVRGRTAPLRLTIDTLTVEDTALHIPASAKVDRYLHRLTTARGMAARHLRLTLTTTAHPDPAAMKRTRP